MEHKPDSEGLLLVAELWRRRCEFLWKMCEFHDGREFDVEWLDEQIEKYEEILK